MKNLFARFRSYGSRTAAAVGAAALVAVGLNWDGFAAGAQTDSEPRTAVVAASPAAAGMRDSYADIVKVISPAVVTVRIESRPRVSPTSSPRDDFFRRFFGDEWDMGPRRMPAPRRGLGSGVVVSGDGYILTNHHVIEGADEIVVEFSDGRSETATLVGSDEPSDLAVLKIDTPNLKALTLGDSDAVEVGDVVLAVGNPLGIGQTVTMGIISGKGRSTGFGDGSYEDFLQTDAPINQGNSGGALVNTKGELIGINSQILSTSGGNIGIGFAIPANMARYVMTELRTEGRVRRSRMGVGIQPVTSDLAASLGLEDVGGALVNSVEPGSAAEKAGLKVGDVIKSFDGEPVRNINSLRNRVAEVTPGEEATVVVVRDSGERTITVQLEEAPASRSARNADGGEADPAALGVAVAPLTPELAAEAGLPRGARGLLVQDVSPGGRAADAGIRPGDVIREANRAEVSSVDELRSAVRNTTDRPLLLLVSRDGRDMFLTVSKR